MNTYPARLTGMIMFVLTLCAFHGYAQDKDPYRWWNPISSAGPVIGGRGWQAGMGAPYDRLPEKAKALVRSEVWELSHNSAGEYISFSTTAKHLTVRYQVKGARSMVHMPATSVSGVDLYGKDKEGRWHWARAAYRFGDTIEYRFSNLPQMKEFRLYLPLYTSVSWLNIGVSGNDGFNFLPVSREPAIVVYGTSIAQGACASRPGLAWTNMLNRQLNLPVVNLGFSGNGRLEPAITALMNEIPARLYILDCLPNLHEGSIYSREEIIKRILASVNGIRSAHPKIPILLTEHACGLPINLDAELTAKYTRTNRTLADAIDTLRKAGVKNIYRLRAGEIGFTAESTVDGTHPTDIGMKHYADAYEKVIRRILKL